MKKLRWTLLLVAGMFAQTAMAATHLPPLKLDQIVTQQQEIRAGVIAGTGRYKDMPENKKAELLAKQGQLLKLIDGKADTAELTPAQSIEAFNILEWIEAAINNSDDERMVCRNQRKTGSNRMTTVCRTQRQINEAHERARRQTEGSMPLDL
jgi:hypothetical protein